LFHDGTCLLRRYLDLKIIGWSWAVISFGFLRPQSVGLELADTAEESTMSRINWGVTIG
jgi:hypothetical protein